MATAPLPLAPIPVQSFTSDQEVRANRALYTLSIPLRADGKAPPRQQVEMRAFDTADYAVLDELKGQPMALAIQLVALLCDLPVKQVKALPRADFTMLASDAIYDMQQFCNELGLPHDFVIQGKRSH